MMSVYCKIVDNLSFQKSFETCLLFKNTFVSEDGDE